MSLKGVYEIVDYSDDDMYFALGIFESLEKAKLEIESAEYEDHPISPFCYGEYEKIVIMKRKFGWTENGTEVYSISREEYYDEENDEYKWRQIKKEVA